MDLSDPSREPELQRAMPADAVPGSTIPEDTEAEVLLRDGAWIWAQVIGQRKDRHGRWCVGLRWYASSSIGGREGWFLYNPAFIRRVNRPLLHLRQYSPGRPAPLTQAGRGGAARLRCAGVSATQSRHGRNTSERYRPVSPRVSRYLYLDDPFRFPGSFRPPGSVDSTMTLTEPGLADLTGAYVRLPLAGTGWGAGFSRPSLQQGLALSVLVEGV